MKKGLLLFCLLVSITICAQVEPISSVNVGAYVDHTIVPLSPQSNYSHSQTIYYKDQLEFRGYINEISYFTPFSNYTTTNVPVDPADLTIKLAMTDVEEFDASTSFIPDTEFTQMTNILRSTSVYEVRYTFETPFYYDGTQNLVIDVEDLNPYASTSATDGYRGVENFGNPPTRSIISLTTINEDESTSTSILKENSYPQTKFYGTLERCGLVSVINHTEVLSTSAVANLNYNESVTTVRYKVTEDIEQPETYETTTSNILPLTGLLPAQKYYTHVKSDCDEIPSRYRSYPFTTRPSTLSLPHTIDFDGEFQRDYVTNREMPYGIEISSQAANNSANGIRFFGPSYPEFLSWVENGDPFEENEGFIRELSLDIDLTGTVNPIIQFDIQQPIIDSYFRVKVSDFGVDHVAAGLLQGYVHQTNTDDADEFKKVVIDLSGFVGEQITLKLQCVSKSTTRQTYLDSIELLENNCLFDPVVNTVASETGVAIDWSSSQSQHEVLITPYNEYPAEASTITTNLNYDFTNLEIGSPYEVYLRSHCATNISPYFKQHVTTKTTPLVIPYSSNLTTTLSDGEFFVVQFQDGADITSSNGIVLHQKICNAEWVGGDTATESEVWDDNKDFITGLKYRIDGSIYNNLNMTLYFKQFHSYYSVPAHSWFRVLINGTQVGPSYNPATRNSDPITGLNIDLSPYEGSMIDIELQQVGKSLSFSTGTASGDATRLVSLAISGTLSVDSNVLNDAVSIYPNPANNQLTISTTIGLDRISILDLNGRLLSVIDRNGEIESYVLDVNHLSKGVYFLELISGDSKSIKKFMKN